MSESEKRRLLAYRMRRLDRRCAAGRPTYLGTEPDGVEATLRYADAVSVPVVVSAAWEPGERPSVESPGSRSGWEVLAVWLRRRGAWVDIVGRLDMEQLVELETQLDN